MYSVIQTGMVHGMQTLDQCLRDLVGQGLISHAHAVQKAADPKTF